MTKITRRRILEKWWILPVGATAGTFAYMGWYATRVTLGKQQAGKPNFVAQPPQQIALLSALAKDWAQVEFSYAGQPCTLLRVPSAVKGGLNEINENGSNQHFVAFSRVCTHLGCSVNLVRDSEILAFAFNYRPEAQDLHPQLGCHCHYSVFDPMQAGAAVFGKANSPLPRVQLELRSGAVWAVGIEPAPKIGG